LPRTVLLADDSVTAQNMGRRILTDAGYEVITVNNGSAALKKIHEVRPDLIVLDVYMPGYGGLEVCQRLKESGETSKIPVLLTVGKMEPFKADEAKRVRADAHIVKPFEASELLAALTKLEDRIVPQAESTRGRKSKKPSFWHDDDRPGQRDRTETEEAHKNNDEDSELSAEAVGDRAADSAPKVGAFPLVPEATGELPVIADSNAFLDLDEGSATASKATASSTSAALEGMAAADPEPRPTEAEPESDRRPEENGEGQNPDVSLAESGADLRVEPQPAESAGPAAGDAAPANARWIAENVALTPEEAAIELEQEMRSAENGQAEIAQSSEVNKTPTADVPESRGATFAAAAGAGSTPATSVSAEDEPGPGVASEAVAAWENWQQIREAVMNVHSTAAIAESVAEVAKTGIAGAKPAMPQPSQEPQESVAQESSIAKSSPESPQSSDLEAGALASIVDTVLAELKPKLMEEIAKKLKK
jgi:CheY-like chemotaxis protein